MAFTRRSGAMGLRRGFGCVATAAGADAASAAAGSTDCNSFSSVVDSLREVYLVRDAGEVNASAEESRRSAADIVGSFMSCVFANVMSCNCDGLSVVSKEADSFGVRFYGGCSGLLLRINIHSQFTVHRREVHGCSFFCLALLLPYYRRKRKDDVTRRKAISTSTIAHTLRLPLRALKQQQMAS